MNKTFMSFIICIAIITFNSSPAEAKWDWFGLTTSGGGGAIIGGGTGYAIGGAFGILVKGAGVGSSLGPPGAIIGALTGLAIYGVYKSFGTPRTIIIRERSTWEKIKHWWHSDVRMWWYVFRVQYL